MWIDDGYGNVRYVDNENPMEKSMLKSIVKNAENEINSKPYPKLMIDEFGNILLVNRKNGKVFGTIISSPSNRYELGTYSTEWFNDQWSGVWSDYKGYVTLEQD